MCLEALKNRLFNRDFKIEKARKEALQKAYNEALRNYQQAISNFCYAEELYVEKSIYDLKSAKLGLSNAIEVYRGEKRLGNKSAN